MTKLGRIGGSDCETLKKQSMRQQVGRFKQMKPGYRRGFEDALKKRGKASERPDDFIASPAGPDNEAFRRGYERGLRYQKALREKYKV